MKDNYSLMSGRKKFGHHHSLKSSQQGATLVIGLVMLILLTIIGVTSMRTTTLEERMAGNLRDHNQAFQAAEAALREAEQKIITGGLPIFNGTTPGYEQPVDSGGLLSHWTGFDWDTKSSEFSEDISNLIPRPRYFIEELPPIPPEGGSKKFGPLSGHDVYRVTAQGIGGVSTTRVFLQTTYRR